MKQLIALSTILILVLSSVSFQSPSVAPAYANSQDQCNQVSTYEKTADFNDSRVTIDFRSNDTRIDVSADSGYTIQGIWLDVDDDGQSGYVYYGTSALSNFNPSGDEINKVKVQVKKVCVTPTATPTPTPQHIQVKICHATGSQSNPFTVNTVDDDAVDGTGSSDHNRSGHQNGEDIIPPGLWDADGRNWTSQNQAIWNNNCTIPSVTPTATPTIVTPSPTVVTPTPTTVVTPTVTIIPTIPVTPTVTPVITLSPTDTPTPTPTTDPNGNQGNGNTVTPTATPSATLIPTVTNAPTPTATVTSTPSSTTNGGDGRSDGLSDGRSDGLSSTPQKTVEGIQLTMGTSKMASTGTFVTTVMNLMFGLGAMTTGLGYLSYKKQK